MTRAAARSRSSFRLAIDLAVATELRDDAEFAFDQLTDVCGVDYLTYGKDEWTTYEATDSGFSRGVERAPVVLDDAESFDPRRFAVVYHLLSISNNYRLRLRVFTGREQSADSSLRCGHLEFSQLVRARSVRPLRRVV